MAMYLVAFYRIPGFSVAEFRAEARQIYEMVNSAHATGKLKTVQRLLTDKLYNEMSAQEKQRAKQWKRVVWSAADVEAVPVQVRCAFPDPTVFLPAQQTAQMRFFQITVRIASKQRFVAYNDKGKVVAGDRENAFQVVDHWVFEHAGFPHIDRHWRVAARLAT